MFKKIPIKNVSYKNILYYKIKKLYSSRSVLYYVCFSYSFFLFICDFFIPLSYLKFIIEFFCIFILFFSFIFLYICSLMISDFENEYFNI